MGQAITTIPRHSLQAQQMQVTRCFGPKPEASPELASADLTTRDSSTRLRTRQGYARTVRSRPGLVVVPETDVL